MFILSSANAFNLDRSKNLLFGEELRVHKHTLIARILNLLTLILPKLLLTTSTTNFHCLDGTGLGFVDRNIW